MRQVITISVDEVIPEAEAVLSSLHVPQKVSLNDRFVRLLQTGLASFSSQVRPAGLLCEISREEFGTVYRGRGSNEPETPLLQIYPKAQALALFAVTLGAEVSREIEFLFRIREFAHAAILDAAASQAAERAGESVTREFASVLSGRGEFGWDTRLIRYSPGYCGWHLSGQKALFEWLRPDEIGITLNESFLMEPLKSMSGVIIAGPKEIHDFDDVYPFCASCEGRTCRERIRRALSE